MIVPREGNILADQCFAGYHSFNGNGEMTGTHWVDESGLLATPIAITNTHQVGLVRDALVEYEVRPGSPRRDGLLPVVAETYDGWLNDIDAFHVTREHVLARHRRCRTRPGGRRQRGRRDGHDLPRVQGRHRHLVAAWPRPAASATPSACWCRPTTATAKTCAWTACRSGA